MLSYSNKISTTNKPMLRKRVLNIIEDELDIIVPSLNCIVNKGNSMYKIIFFYI